MIPKIAFDNLISIDEWSDALRRILDAAKAAAGQEDSQDRQKLQDLLLTFVKKSPAKVELLDVIARGAIEDLAVAEITARLDRIASRTAELNRTVGLVESVTEEAKKSERALRLESTIEVLNKAKAAIDAFKKVEKAFTNPDLTLLNSLTTSADAIATAAKALGSSNA